MGSALAASNSSAFLYVGLKSHTNTRGMALAAVPDEGGWAWGKQWQAGTTGTLLGCAAALAPGDAVILVSSCGTRTVGIANTLGLDGFNPTAAMSKTVSPLYPSPAAVDGFGAAVAIAPANAPADITVIGAPGEGSGGAVLIYAGSGVAAASLAPSASPSQSPTPSHSRPSQCGALSRFTYIGAHQYYVVPSGVNWLSVHLWGGGGGSGTGGGGAFVSGNLSVVPGQTLRVIVGTGGGAVSNNIQLTQVGGAAGFGYPNGGGRSAIQARLSATETSQFASIWSGLDELRARGIAGGFYTDLVTAAGGGGGTASYAGSPGSGGTLSSGANSYAGPRGSATTSTCGICVTYPDSAGEFVESRGGRQACITIAV
jgi:hypothetical protein